MNIFYMIIIAVLTLVHIDIGITNRVSPIDFTLILLLLIPFLTIVWKDASKIKFGSNGLELEKEKANIDKTIKNVVQGDSIDHKSIETLFNSVQTNDWLKLVLSRMLMRKGLVTLLPNHSFGDSPSLTKLIDSALELEKISSDEKDELEKLRNITYYAEWWGGDAPKREEWKWAISNCKQIIEKLFDKQLIA
ncbi:MAG: hypothetical protein KAQ94_02495 [Arcobacteraceae bacterium]|nr:hypothetical protein [Arcobacteraceae bacterium]